MHYFFPLNRLLHVAVSLSIFLPAAAAVSLRLGNRQARTYTNVDPPKVLLYWAAKSDEQIIDLVIKNVNHYRASGAQCDVLLGHYDLNKDVWLRRNRTWYEKNVRWGINERGWKIHLLRNIYAYTLGKDLNLSNYDWVWMMDEDLDFGDSDIFQLFNDAEATGSMIVGPAFVQRKADDPNMVEAPFYPMNIPRNYLQFHYVPMVEVIMPLMRPDALDLMLRRKMFLAPQNHDWGLDHVWCSYVARYYALDSKKVCAIIDNTGPIVHLNFQSTRDAGGKAETKDIGNEATAWVRSHHHEDWVSFPNARKNSWTGYGGRL